MEHLPQMRPEMVTTDKHNHYVGPKFFARISPADRAAIRGAETTSASGGSPRPVGGASSTAGLAIGASSTAGGTIAARPGDDEETLLYLSAEYAELMTRSGAKKRVMSLARVQEFRAPLGFANGSLLQQGSSPGGSSATASGIVFLILRADSVGLFCQQVYMITSSMIDARAIHIISRHVA